MAKTCQAPDCINPSQSHGFCFRHGYLRKDEKYLKSLNKPKKIYNIPRTPPKNDFKPTGEGLLFSTILDTRKHISFVSSQDIDKIDGFLDHNNCHHVLYPKDDYKKFRLYDKNIVLVTKYEHWLIHDGGIERRTKYTTEMAKNGIIVNWDKLYALREELFEEHKLLK